MAGTTGGGAPAPAAATTILPTVAGHTVVEVTFPRRNTISGRGDYSIKSETYDPRSSKY